MFIWNWLNTRGFLYQSINQKQLTKGLGKNLRFYVGFDPTADSLHIGHLLVLTVVRFLQQNNNTPYIILGGGTGFIGDPSGKTKTRKLINSNTLVANQNALVTQLAKFVDFQGPNAAVVLDNSQWLRKLDFLVFLRDYGGHFSVNKLLTITTFKKRLTENLQLSFLEFSYVLLQAYDFYYLCKNHNVVCQIGGSDQWNNILFGVELIKKKLGIETCGFTLNLLIKSDGEKMGKTTKATIWLDPKKTSPYDFYQYWLNIADADVSKFLFFFSDLSPQQINDLTSEKGPKMNQAKKILAEKLTTIVHGKKCFQLAYEQSAAAFHQTGTNWPTLVIDKAYLQNDFTIINLLYVAKLATSKTQARYLITNKAVKINGCVVDDLQATFTSVCGLQANDCIIQKGKKKRFKIILK